MEQLPPNYNKIPRLSPAEFLNEGQLPLYGLVHNAEAIEDEYLLAGVKITSRLLRPTWEQPTVHKLPREERLLPQRRVLLGVQPSAIQEALTVK